VRAAQPRASKDDALCTEVRHPSRLAIARERADGSHLRMTGNSAGISARVVARPNLRRSSPRKRGSIITALAMNVRGMGPRLRRDDKFSAVIARVIPTASLSALPLWN
jgi:hypothetical protein